MEKHLNELYDVEYDTLIKGISVNSKTIKEGELFVCTKGYSADRHDFVNDAVKNGASAIIASKKIDVDVPVIYVDNTNDELINVTSKFYDNPLDKLIVIGITGTDGKTSTAASVQKLIGDDICGNIGTNGYFNKNIKGSTSNTTPAPEEMFKILNEFVNDGCKYVVLEVSSESYFFHRVDYITFDHTLFTNITPEHMNHHKTLENYTFCKGQLFKNTKKDGFVVLNNDSKYYGDMKKYSNGIVCSYGKNNNNDLIIKDFKLSTENTIINYEYNNESFEIISPLLGDFNVYNLSAAILLCLKLNIPLSQIKKNVKDIYVSGRIDMLDTNTNFKVIVDYAHTPNGIISILNFTKMLKASRSIVVLGSAGERDHDKRPLMGKTATDNADYVIFTYEDPRSEDPKDIIDDLVKDVKDKSKYEIVIDRREAIRKAISIAKENDMVLILGKGNETYQKLKNETIYFNDEEEAYKAIKELKK